MNDRDGLERPPMPPPRPPVPFPPTKATRKTSLLSKSVIPATILELLFVIIR